MKKSGLLGITASSVLFVAVLLLTSCEKPEGYGGTAVIKGTLYDVSYNDDYSDLLTSEPSVDEEVFLVFGDSDVLGDRVFTSHKGAFEFPYLQPGSYTLYYSGEDTATISRKEVSQLIELNIEAGEVKDLGELTRARSLDFDEGTAKIYGVVTLINYRNSSVYPFLEIKDVSLAQNEDVYLTFGDHPMYDANIDTGFDGYFEFTNLIPGTYEIYLYSEDVTGGTEDIKVSKTVTVTEAGQEFDLGVITIEQL